MRRSSKRRLRSSKGSYEVIANTVADAIITVDEHGTIVFANQTAERIFGYSAVELIGKKLTVLIPESLRQKHIDAVREYLCTGKRHRDWTRVELTGLHKDGHGVPLEVSYGEFVQDGKRFFTGVARDISERKRAQDALRESEERNRMITELMSDFAYFNRLEEYGRMAIVWMTDSFSKVTGYTVEEARVPGFLKTFVHPDDLPVASKNIEQLLHGIPYELEARVITKDGHVLWMHNYAIPIVDQETGRVTHIYGIARDITRRKEDEQRLRNLAAELLQTEERERRRMAMYLHDIIGQTMALCKLKLRSLQRSNVSSDGMEKALRELQELVEQSIRDTQTLTFELCPPILYELSFEAAMEWLADRLHQQHEQVSFTVESDKTSKPMPTEVRVIVFQAVREVCMNVIKHAEARNVRICLTHRGDNLSIEVIDDGVGFKHSDHTRTDGGGFGLFNVRTRLEQLGGRLTIESTPGCGTCVRIEVPLAADAVMESDGA